MPVRTRFKHALQTMMTAAIAVALAQVISFVFRIGESQNYVVWLPSGVLLAILTLSPRPQWLFCVIGGIVGQVALFAALGQPPAEAAAIFSVPFALTAIVVTFMRRLRDSPLFPIDNFRALTFFFLAAAIALPLLSAAWAAWVVPASTLSRYFSDASNFGIAQALGAMLVPTAISTARHLRDVNRKMLPRVSAGLIMLLVMGVAWWLTPPESQLIPALTAAPAPIIVWALVYYRTTGGCLALLAICALAATFATLGGGVFGHLDPMRTCIGLQLWMAIASLALLHVAVVVEQRNTVRTEMERAGHELTRLTGRLIAAQEEERGRIARELHDSVNQSLAAVAIQLSIARREATPAMQPMLLGLLEEVTRVSEDVRNISHELHPSLLRQTGLEPALRMLCSAMETRGIPVDCKLHFADTPPPPQALALYRIAQEALANVQRHAEARTAELRLVCGPERAEMQICDDGIGWSLNDATIRRDGLGLLSIEERVRHLGGSFRVDTAPGEGTRLIVTLPLRTHSREISTVD